MSHSNSKIVEGVFAINKPPALSSGEVVRQLQHRFNPSKLFAPWIEGERSRRNQEIDRHGRKKRKDKRINVKIGHGGTLDPMATGVLILGVGKGTKHLQGFLECTKTYEATVLFGAATDTYDALGKVLRRGPYRSITREKVEAALERYRGNIMQRPPLYSALRIDGKRLYEYAREGKEVPREIEKRPVEVKELEIVDWLEGGKHKYRLPEEEAEAESKEIAEKVLHFDEVVGSPEGKEGLDVDKTEGLPISKRKRSLIDSDETGVVKKKPNLEKQETDSKTLMSGALNPEEDRVQIQPQKDENAKSDEHTLGSQQTSVIEDLGPPAVKLRMTVTSGFYVRSLSHDLGEALGSLACMTALVRLRQGQFELGRNVLEYENIDEEEEVWGPKVKGFLDDWERETEGKTPGPAKHTQTESLKEDLRDGRTAVNDMDSAAKVS